MENTAIKGRRIYGIRKNRKSVFPKSENIPRLFSVLAGTGSPAFIIELTQHETPDKNYV